MVMKVDESAEEGNIIYPCSEFSLHKAIICLKLILTIQVVLVLKPACMIN